MIPVVVIEPSAVWHKRALIFSVCFLVLILGGAYFVPLTLLLAPFVAYRALHAYRFLKPGRVGIELFDDRLLCRPAFGKPREVLKSEIVRFLTVYSGTTEVVVARCEDVDVRGTQERQLKHPTDVVMPSGLMRNPGLVRRLEAWRTGTLVTESLIPKAS